MSTIDQQPTAKRTLKERAQTSAKKFTTREGWLGEFDFAHLCMPQMPYHFGKGPQTPRKPPPFYALDADLPILLAIVAGFQHALAMLGGLITPPIIFANALSLDAATQSYMISASLIASGFLSMIQMSRFKLPFGYYLGTGLITVVGTSFATLSSAFAVFNAYYADGKCSTVTDAAGIVTRSACPDAFGALLGTSMLCSLLEMGMAFIPPAKLRKIFPPIVTGVVVFLIGASLIGESGLLAWGGSSNDCHLRPETGFFALCPNINAPNAAKWGSPQFIGLGFLSFMTIVLTEIFGSPFLRNASIIVGLVVGMIVAGPTGYVDGSRLAASPAITFLWTTTFKLSIYGPAILPMFAVYISLAMEAIGDITASSEASRVEVEGPLFDSRIQGGVLADGLAGLLSGLGTVSPMSIFAQNNGVITLTRCANRKAGYVCACFLVFFGVLGKIAGVFLSIPPPVLGGVTTFLFASVATSGVRVLSYIKWTRRDRFILAASLAFGLGNLLVPDFATHLFDDVPSTNSGLRGFLSSITIVLSTPYLIAGVVGVLLNSLLPYEVDERVNIFTEDPDVESGAADISKNQQGSIEDSGDEKEHESKGHESGASATTTAIREVV
ncbi:xanthine uracil permease [Mrakia frigida]|uniref:xanthine uracil permease n=1 Tax=Mrakia frigida TaxID=29902 RepID=UPI003FCC0E25